MTGSPLAATARSLGFCSISALDRPLEAVARLAATAGLDAIEVTARPPHVDPSAPPASLAGAARAVREAGCGIIAYGSYLGRPELHGESAVARECEIAAVLGTKLLRVWADGVPGDADGGFARVVATLAAACDRAAAADTTVVVERHLGSFADTPERIAALFDAVARPNLALNYQVLDFLPQAAAAAQPDDARALAPRSAYLHLKNFRPAADGRGPMPPGASLGGGVLDYRAILAAALGAGYAGPLTIEFLSFEPKPLEEKLAEDAAWLRGALAELGQP